MGKTLEEMTPEERSNLGTRARKLLMELLIDQENERLREDGADFEYRITFKEVPPPAVRTN